MSKEIEIRMEKWERAIVMQVTKQDESLRGDSISDVDKNIFHNGELYIRSVRVPFIDKNNVFLRGENTERDFEIISMCFSTNEERDEHHKKFVKLFKDYNERDKEEETQKEQTVFTLK